MSTRKIVRICIDQNVDARLLALLRGLPRRANGEAFPITFHFLLAFPTTDSAVDFVQEADREGFSTVISPVAEVDAPWGVTASKNLPPIDSEIADVERQLHALAIRHGGRSVCSDSCLLGDHAGDA